MLDIFGIHTENCVSLLALTFFMIVWSADRNPTVGSREFPGTLIKCEIKIQLSFPLSFAGFRGFNECVLSLILHYSCYLTAVLYFNPEDEVAIGIKEPIGPCHETSPVQTAFGMVSINV